MIIPGIERLLSRIVPFTTMVVIVLVATCGDPFGPGIGIVHAAQGRVRELSWDPHLRVPDRLLPDDETVVMTREGLEVVGPAQPWTVTQVIEHAALRSDLVAVVDVDSVKGVLVLNDSWVYTRLAGTVREVLRTSRALQFEQGQRIEGDYPNGEIMLGGVRVKAGDRAPVNIPTFPEHRSYLLFLSNERGILQTAHPPLLIQDGKLTYLSPFRAMNLPPDALQGLTVAEVARVARDAKTSPPMSGGILQPIGR